MAYPRLLIDTNKVKKNVEVLVEMTKKANIEVAGVTKVFSGYHELVQAYIDGGVKYLADSRILNLKELSIYNIPKIMLRLPMISEVEDVVSYSDISLNSEVDTIVQLSNAAIKLNKVHGIILMFDLGDLREGFFIEEDLYNSIEMIKDLKGINIIGLASNLTCYGGVIPDKKILERLVSIANKIESRFNIKLEIISGGNSSSIYLLEGQSIYGVNNLRLGESLLFGTESAFGQRIENTFNDAFTLEVEVIEIKEKPSVPTEKIGRDAFGKVPTFIDRGIRKRIICAVGKEDIDFDTIYPLDKGIIILGGSSDHLILDASDSRIDYKLGDIIKFNIHYVSLLRIMTSRFVEKIVI